MGEHLWVIAGQEGGRINSRELSQTGLEGDPGVGPGTGLHRN